MFFKQPAAAGQGTSRGRGVGGGRGQQEEAGKARLYAGFFDAGPKQNTGPKRKRVIDEDPSAGKNEGRRMTRSQSGHPSPSCAGSTNEKHGGQQRDVEGFSNAVDAEIRQMQTPLSPKNPNIAAGAQGGNARARGVDHGQAGHADREGKLAFQSFNVADLSESRLTRYLSLAILVVSFDIIDGHSLDAV